MTFNVFARTAAAALALLVTIALAACGDDPGLSRAEVEEIAQSAAAAVPEPEPGLNAAEVEAIVRAAIAAIPESDPGLTPAKVEQIVQDAIADIPEPERGLTTAEAEEIVRAAITAIPAPEPGLTAAEAQRIARSAVAAIPIRSAPADYTRFFVENAISQYESGGLDATLRHYSRAESVDGQWYVFIIGADDRVIAHYDNHLIGEDLTGPLGTDANGYNFGPEMLSATEEGKWVSYVYRNPESGGLGTGAFQLKNAWVVRHDGLLFGSGWYIDADEFTKLLVSIAVDKFRFGGLEATVAYFAEPDSALAGLEAAIDYYNQAETIDGKWSAFIAADESGTIVAHSDPTVIGSGLRELFGAGSIEATGEGNWITTGSARMWVVASGGFVFGSGWHHDGSGN